MDNNIKGVLAYTDDFSQAFYIDSYKKELKSTYSKTIVKLGTRVTVKVYEVNIPQKEVYLELMSFHKSTDLVRRKSEN